MTGSYTISLRIDVRIVPCRTVDSMCRTFQRKDTIGGEAARIGRAGFWRIVAFVMLPMSVNILIVATILQQTGIWNDLSAG